MSLKIIVVLGLLAHTSSQQWRHAASYSSVKSLSRDFKDAGPDLAPGMVRRTPIAPHKLSEYFAWPRYQYEYSVHDGRTLDIKNQEESRDGDVVRGSYRLLQPDGRTRIVHYTSDQQNGFQVQVEYSGKATHLKVPRKRLVSIYRD